MLPLLASLAGCASDCGPLTVEVDGHCVAIDFGATTPPSTSTSTSTSTSSTTTPSTTTPSTTTPSTTTPSTTTPSTTTTTTTTTTTPTTTTTTTTPLDDGVSLVVAPGSLDFGDLVLPCSADDAVLLVNPGTGAREVRGVQVDPAGAPYTFDLPGALALPFVMAPGDVVEIAVRAAPTAEGPLDAELLVDTDDPTGVHRVPLTGTAAYQPQAEVFVAPKPEVDVVFLVDGSCSMSDAHDDDLATGLPLWLDALDAAADWHLIEVTQDSGCANVGVFDASTPFADTLLLDHAWDGTSGSPYLTEMLFRLAYVALGQTGPGQCNDGFLRPGAQLHVVTVSDEPEQSGTLWSDWLGLYETVASPVVTSAVAALGNCGTGSGGYANAAVASGGVLLDLCPNHWGAAMAILPDAVRDVAPAFQLADDPVAGTLAVSIAGAAVPFTFDPGPRVVALVDAVPADTVVDVAYSAEAQVCP